MNVARTLTLLSLPAISLVMAAPALAAPPVGVPGFGQHVSACAQTMGFSGTHNPGMHHGAAGWDGMPC